MIGHTANREFVYPFKVVLHAFLLLGHLYINILFSELLERVFLKFISVAVG